MSSGRQQENVNAPCGRGESYGRNGHNQNNNNHNGSNLAPSILEMGPAVNTVRDPSMPTLSHHPNAKVLPDKHVLPHPPQVTRENSFLRGLSTSSLGDWVWE